MTYLIDSDVLVDNLRGAPYAEQWLLTNAGNVLAVSIISVAELYTGALRSQMPLLHLDAIRSLLGQFTILNVSNQTALEYARQRVQLQKRGTPLPDFDLLIAATALRYSLTLVTRNLRHFQRINVLVLEVPRV